MSSAFVSNLANEELVGVILAGGQAKRFGGVNKALLPVANSTIYGKQREALLTVCSRIVIAAAGAIRWNDASDQVVVDATSGSGPLAGIYAALQTVPSWAFVVAGDMPNLNPAILQLLAAKRSDSTRLVGCEIAALPQPLCALYHRDALPVIAQQLERGDNKVARLFSLPTLQPVLVAEDKIRVLDPDLAMFHNVNSPSDLAQLTTPTH